MRIQSEDVDRRGPCPQWLDQRIKWEQRQLNKLQDGQARLQALKVIEHLESQRDQAILLWQSSQTSYTQEQQTLQ